MHPYIEFLQAEAAARRAAWAAEQVSRNRALVDRIRDWHEGQQADTHNSQQLDSQQLDSQKTYRMSDFVALFHEPPSAICPALPVLAWKRKPTSRSSRP